MLAAERQEGQDLLVLLLLVLLLLPLEHLELAAPKDGEAGSWAQALKQLILEQLSAPSHNRNTNVASRPRSLQ